MNGAQEVAAPEAVPAPSTPRLRARGSAIVSVYSAFIRNAFLSMLAYRLRYYTGIVTYLLFVSVNYFIWCAVYSGKPAGETIHGFTFGQMITYISVGWIARSLYYSSIDEEVDDLVRTGQISVYLLRPVNFHLMMVANAFGETLFRLCFFTVPIGAVILWAFPVSLPAGFLSFVYFLISTMVSFFVLAEVGFLVGLLAFVFKSTQGIMRAKYYLIQLFSGLLLPLGFFPPLLNRVLEYLPFKMIAYVPLQLYLGKLSGVQITVVFLEELAWVMLLLALAQWSWSRAVAHLTLQGG